jgi:uncharacterized membrane protein
MQPAQGRFSDRTLVVERNMSSSAAGRRWFFGSIVLVSFGIASLWALNGAWYVLPFAGIEMMVLGAALVVFERHVGDREAITIDGDRVVVERTRMGRTARHEFSRYWAQVVLTPASGRGHGGLAMRSHGRQVEIGEFLTDDQRAAVADELRRRLGT